MKSKCAVVSVSRDGKIVDFSFEQGVDYVYGIITVVDNDLCTFSAAVGSQIVMAKRYFRLPVFYEKEIYWKSQKIKDAWVEGFVGVDEDIEKGDVRVYSVDGTVQTINHTKVMGVLSWYDAVGKRNVLP